MSRKPGALAAVAMAALIVASCSSAPTDSGGDIGAREKAVKFAECMRHNGVKGFPDPDASGTLTIDGIANGTSVETNSAAWKTAIEACKDLQPAGFTGHKRNAQEQEQVLKFAQCVRDNGIKDFPDPAPDAPIIDTERIPSAAGKNPHDIPGFRAALDKCSDHLAGLVNPNAKGQ